MFSVSWWSQPVAAEGSTASEGIRRQLGRPKLDPLEVLVRETAQNSCDAAVGGNDVRYAIRLRTAIDGQLEAWRSLLLPEPAGANLGLAGEMTSGLLLVSVSDRGTTGLGGPLHANEIPHPGERPDFVNFVRNVGENKRLSLGGGSYGFGKGILYNISRCHTILVDSVCSYRGHLERRLIGAALGDGFTYRGGRFTGRHWLGRRDAAGLTVPLLNEEAASTARALGLPDFEPGETGTTVTVVAANLGDGRDDVERNIETAAEFISSAILWNLWPRMLSDRAHRLICSVLAEGRGVDVPDPESTVELYPFVEAYRKLDREGEYTVPIRKSEPREIGRFALVDAMAPIRTGSLIASAAPFTGPAHHCARMRQADLIVDYEEGEASTDEMVQYGAVFRASRAADQFFSDAEPPTHDNWVTSGLAGKALGVVRLANTHIKAEMRNRAIGSRQPVPAGSVPLAALSTKLSGLLAASGNAAQATVTAGQRRSGRATSPSRGPGPRFVDGPALTERDGEVVIRGVVSFPPWNGPRSITARARVVVDGGFEENTGELAEPIVSGWRDLSDRSRSVDGADLRLEVEFGREWELIVRPVADAVMMVELEVGDGKR